MNTPDAVPFHSSPSRLTRSLAGYARLAVGLLALASAHAALAFGFNDVAVRAKQLATKPYQAPTETLPRQLRELRYDQYREIRFKSDQAYWRRDKLPFELGFFHEGSYYDQPVKINEVSPAGVREIRFDPRLFDYGPVKLDAKQLQHLGFAGFRVHYAMNTPKYKDEVIVFLGASYFRAIGKNQVYGLSARGLAIDTALNSGEEFPRFTDFWIERPAANAKELTVYALLNSRRATGAYRFVIKPGTDTVVDVKAQVYMRENVSKLAIAPLTSMFFFGENQPAANLDFRPEVHDSDGLSVLSGTGEWIWRPLTNPKRLLVSSFSTTNPGGFGLMQRDRAFSSYEEIGDRYEQRPTRPTTTWSPTGCPRPRPSRSNRTTSSTACCGKRMATRSRPCRGSRRHAARTAGPPSARMSANPTTRSPLWSTLKARRWPSCRPMHRSNPCSRQMPTARSNRSSANPTPRPAAGA